MWKTRSGDRSEMNDDLTRMVLNPDVTVGPRGHGKMSLLRTASAGWQAEGQERKPGLKIWWMYRRPVSRPVRTEAIVFGNANDSKSAHSKIKTGKRTASVSCARRIARVTEYNLSRQGP